MVCAFVAFTGVRLEVLGNYLGDDGLRVRDLPEMRIEGKNVVFDSIPTMVKVRGELSKSRRPYTTYLGAEGCDYVRDYLGERMLNGEKLTPESDIVSPERSTKAFIRTLNIGDAVRKAIRSAGFPWRPYVLRAYFDTQLLLAESKGNLARDYRVFWMGHVGGMDARYTTNKGRLPKDLIEDMRAAYKRCEPFLSTVPTADSNEGANKVIRALFLSRGMPVEELDKIDLDEKSEAELTELFKKLGAAAGGAVGVQTTQRAVPLEEVPGLLSRGWTFVSSLGPDRAVVQVRPGEGPTVARPGG